MSINQIVTNNPLAEVDWDDVLDTLHEQRCVLFIGNGMYEAPGGGDIHPLLCNWLDIENPDHPHILAYNSDGFFLFRKERFRRHVVNRMKDFYNQSFPETEVLLGRIARLPFPLIFTLAPDNILPRTFDTLGFEYQHDFYFRNRKASGQYEKLDKGRPLLYNLLGNIEEPESIILTHRDFFDYLQSVFTGNSMDESLKTQLENMERYIFLGLPYEKWYFQLLLRIFSLHSDKLKEIERLALKEFENPNLHKIYTEEFKIEFFPAATGEFIDALYHRCEAAGLLKPLPATDEDEANFPGFSTDEIRELVAEARMPEAFQHLKSFLQSRVLRKHSLYNDFIVLRNRYNLLRQRDIRGAIDPRDLWVENNQITEQLLVLLALAENLR